MCENRWQDAYFEEIEIILPQNSKITLKVACNFLKLQVAVMIVKYLSFKIYNEKIRYLTYDLMLFAGMAVR